VYVKLRLRVKKEADATAAAKSTRPA